MKSTYEQRERDAFQKQIHAVESAPLNREDASELDNYLRTNPALILERIVWLIQGCYGKGSYDATREVLQNKRMNRPAWLFQTISALEFGVKSSKARKLWNSLDSDSQCKFNLELSEVIREALADMAAEVQA